MGSAAAPASAVVMPKKKPPQACTGCGALPRNFRYGSRHCQRRLGRHPGELTPSLALRLPRLLINLEKDFFSCLRIGRKEKSHRSGASDRGADDDVGVLGTVPISGREQGRVDDADMSKTTTTQWRPKFLVFKAQQPGLSEYFGRQLLKPIERVKYSPSVHEDAGARELRSAAQGLHNEHHDASAL